VVFRSLLRLTSVDPSTSSTAGGLVITYTGAGFSLTASDNVLTINGTRAHVIHSEYDTLVAVTPRYAPGLSTGTVTVDVDIAVPSPQVPPYYFGQTEPTPHSYDSSSSGGLGMQSNGVYVLPNASTAAHASAITYSAAVTPLVTSVSLTSGREGDTLVVLGQGLAGTNVTEVLIGAQLCQVTVASATSITCTVGPTPAGEHAVYVTVHGAGTAAGSFNFTSVASVSSLSTSSGSYGGGSELTITGYGFGGGAVGAGRRRRTADGAWGGWILYDFDSVELEQQHGTKVELCGKPCEVNSSTYTDVVCSTPAINTPESIAAFNANEAETLVADAYVTDVSVTPADVALAFDGDFATSFTQASWVGIDLGASTLALVTRARFFPAHQQSSLFVGAYFESSVDGVTWVRLTEGNDIVPPHQGWNWATFEGQGQTPARFVRMVSLSPGMYLAGLEFEGVIASPSSACALTVHTTAPLSHPSLGLMTTDHVVVATATGPDFTYVVGSTPVVTSVSPRHGTSLGGTLVTISGSNLPTDVNDIEVAFAGVACTPVSASITGDSIECLTGRRGPIVRHNSVPITLTILDTRVGRGLAVANATVRFRYLDAWSAVNTWLNNEPPVTGDTVVIPTDQTILLDQDASLFLLLVQGALVFDRRDINLDASYIFVQGGLLEVGTEADPFLNQTTITLHGHRRNSIEIPMIGAKVLAVGDRGGFTTMGEGSSVEVPASQRGVLDVHGRPRIRVWTKCAVGTFAAGTTRVVTAEPTDYEPGEIVVITSPSQQLTVSARIDDYTFDVVQPLAVTHISEWFNHSGFELDMRCEVGLVSRNVVIQGAGLPRADGTPTLADGEESSASQLYGVHTGAFHGGEYRMENAEFRHCGQAGVLGRYCTHYHRNGDNPPPRSYVRSNSFHDSFQRAVTVHSTHHALVQNNFAFRVMGHTYFVEDGDERWVKFTPCMRTNSGSTLTFHPCTRSLTLRACMRVRERV
jgi:hypothetical protein